MIAEDSNSRISYCACQLPCKTDEDRFSVHLSDEDSEDTTVSYFGIFDGHGGVFAAKLLADSFHQDVLDKYEKAKQNKAFFDKDDVDTTFCEAFRLASADIDARIRDSSTAGSTQVSIFAFLFPDGSSRVFCPWIGDSRCVMYQVQSKKSCSFEMSVDHKPTLPREKKRIEDSESIMWTGEPFEINYEQDLQTIIDNTIHSCISTSSDKRKVTAIRELPGKFSDEVDDIRDVESSASRVPPITNNWVTDRAEAANSMKSTRGAWKFHSFIDKRSLPGGPKIGPWAVFGRYGTSLAMTRSFGDKYGPRSCVAVPDISATTIPAGKHARFVIASDGLWDTMTTEIVESIALSIANPKEAASKLARMAKAIRVSREMRMDDITCIIVDVNPRNFVAPQEDVVQCNCTIG